MRDYDKAFYKADEDDQESSFSFPFPTIGPVIEPFCGVGLLSLLRQKERRIASSMGIPPELINPDFKRIRMDYRDWNIMTSQYGLRIYSDIYVPDSEFKNSEHSFVKFLLRKLSGLPFTDRSSVQIKGKFMQYWHFQVLERELDNEFDYWSKESMDAVMDELKGIVDKYLDLSPDERLKYRVEWLESGKTGEVSAKISAKLARECLEGRAQIRNYQMRLMSLKERV